MHAEELLQKVSMLYRQCDSYGDEGLVTRVFHPGQARERRNQLVFRTCFKRPSRWFFEWADVPENVTDLNQVNAVWCNGHSNFVFHLDEMHREPTPEAALSRVQGVSSGVSTLIPALLSPDYQWSDRLAKMHPVKMLKAVNPQYYEVSGYDQHLDCLQEVRILAADLSIRQIVQLTEIGVEEARFMVFESLATTGEDALSDISNMIRRMALSATSGLMVEQYTAFNNLAFDVDIQNRMFEYWTPYPYSKQAWMDRAPIFFSSSEG